MRNIRLVFIALISLAQASHFYTTDIRSPFSFTLPFDQNDRGRAKVEVKNFNPGKGASIIRDTMVTVFPFLYIAALPIICTGRMHFPMLNGATEVPGKKEGKWKQIDHQKGKVGFEYHHRSVNPVFNYMDKFTWRNPKFTDFHIVHHRKTCGKRLGFHFDFNDQQPKLYKKMTVKLPFRWSGYKLEWWLQTGEHEQHIEGPADPKTKSLEVDLLKLMSLNQYKFSLYAQFTREKNKRRASDVDLMTLEYQMGPGIDLSQGEYVLVFPDGESKVTKEFIDKEAPHIKMLLGHQPAGSNVVDMRESQLSVQHLELLKTFSQMSFSEIEKELNELPADQLTDLLLMLDYFIASKEYKDAAMKALKEKITFQNGCSILRKIPKNGGLIDARKELQHQFEKIFIRQFRNPDHDFESVCQRALQSE